MKSLQAVLDAIEAILVERIPEMVRAAHVVSPSYCVVLSYGWDDWWPPGIMIGADSDRPSEGSGVDPYAPYELSCGAHCMGFVLEGPVLDELGAELEKYVQAFSFRNDDYAVEPPDVPLGEGEDPISACRSLLENVGRKLHDYDWRSILPITKDFKFVVCDSFGPD